MPPKTNPYLLSEVLEETPDTRTFVLKPQAGGEIPAFKPGQFVNLYLTHENCPAKMARSYSVASSPATRDRFELTIKDAGEGHFPRNLWDLKPGHLFGLLGPFGHFVFDPATMPHIVLLGAGVGVTPMMGMIRYCRDMKLENRITFLDVNKTLEDTIYLKELSEVHEKENPRLKWVRSYTRLKSEDPWPGRRGRLDWEMILENVDEPMNVHYFICGPDQMNKDISALLLEKGVPKERVKLENMGF